MSTSLATTEALSFENHAITFAEVDGGRWIQASDLAAPLGISRGSLRDRLRNLDDSDKGVVLIDTLGGPQNVTIVSESGALQIVVQSRKPEAARLRKWICDIFVQWRAGKLQPHSGYGMFEQVAGGIMDQLERLTAAVAQLQEQSQKATARIVETTDDGEIIDMHNWSASEMMRVRKRGYLTAREWLEVNEPNSKMLASALAQRCINYAKRNRNREAVMRYLRGRRTKVTVIHRQVLRFMFNWAHGRADNGPGAQLLLLPGGAS